MSARARLVGKTHVLSKLKNCKSITKRRDLLTLGGHDLQKTLREIAFNILQGNVKLTSSQLKRLACHKEGVRCLARKATTYKARLATVQKGGFLSALLTPVLGALAGTVLRGFVR